ncbi:hypothetical protein [Pseudomonas sp. RIT-PI-S]|uniref:hypothetical protein n=1 Tax=Pseudomonas sp. RIT-PI-S TaxID=3035295 RepID=UPI0021D9818B|nr:hypothetical protein [Pseudomonas sp. RIT-PI-S]
MNIAIDEDHINTADLRGAVELWLVSPQAAPDANEHPDGLCLWRGRPVVSHDMLSEGTHEQNVRRVWLRVADPLSPATAARVRPALEQRLREQQLEGEFFPAETAG